MTTYIDINCDMGESYGRWTLGADEEVMPHITSANIACGFHGGDPHVIRKTVELAVQHGVAGGGDEPPAREGARHPVLHFRGDPGARPCVGRAGRRARPEPDPDDDGDDEV